MAAQPSLLCLPVEILVLIMQFYFMACMNDRHSRFPNGRFPIKICLDCGRDAYRRNTQYPHLDIRLLGTKVFETSKVVREAAQTAAAQACHGSLELVNISYPWGGLQWHDTSYTILTEHLPTYLLRTIDIRAGRGRPFSGHTLFPMSWKRLIRLITSGNWPVLETVTVRMNTPRHPRFNICQIGELLRGQHDQALLDSWTRWLPWMSTDDPRELQLKPEGTTNYREIAVEVHVDEAVKEWIHAWEDFFFSLRDDSTFTFILRGKNFEELRFTDRIFSSPSKTRYVYADEPDSSSEEDESNDEDDLDHSDEVSESCQSDESGYWEEVLPEMIANGSDWEEKAATRWPDLEHLFGKVTVVEDQ